MNPLLKILSSATDIESLNRLTDEADFIAFDTETDGVHHGAQVIGFSICVSETETYYIPLLAWSVDQQSLVSYLTTEARDAALALLRSLSKRQNLICHNAIFDAMRVEENFKISLMPSIHTDTMVLAHILNENRRIGLKELAAETFGDDAKAEQQEMQASVISNGGRWSAREKDMYKADVKILGKYGAKDAWLTYMLFMDMVPQLYEQGLNVFFYEEESMPLLRGPTYDLNSTGLKVDQDALITLKKTLQAECAAAKDFIHQEIYQHVKERYPGTTKKNTFNIGSSNQLSWLLFGVLGLEFGTLTKGGKELCKRLNIRIPYHKSAKSEFIYTITRYKESGMKIRDPWAYIACDKKTLGKFEEKYKWVKRLLEYNRIQKLLSTYVEGIEERMQYGVIRPSFLQTGTTSGRYSSRDPNFQNLPRDDKRVKACLVARPGKSFVGADYSQLEPRVFASLSQDTRLMAAFESADDFYSVIGMPIYGKYDCTPRKDGSPDAFGVKYKKLRDYAKVIALASTYGATARQLAPTTGKSIEDTELDIENYFEAFPKVKEFMLESHRMAKTTGQVAGTFGRPRRMPEAKNIDKIYRNADHADLPYEARNILNLAVNHRVQSTGASICNRAMIKFHEDVKLMGIQAKIVVQIHDEIIVECDDKDTDNVLILLQNAMETAADLPGVKLEAKPTIGKTLASLK